MLGFDGGGQGLCEPGVSESAGAAPQVKMSGGPAFKDGIEMAAAYLFYLFQNHPFKIDSRTLTGETSATIFSKCRPIACPALFIVERLRVTFRKKHSYRILP